jgi:type I restriction enzyme R subunit
VKVYSRVAAIIDFEVKEWEKMFWYLRFLIPGLHVDVAGRDDMRDLLDNVDLNTYGLRRTALNQTVDLDDSETVVDPNKAAMAGAGGDEVIEDPLIKIIEAFNELHFTGWEATPDDQKAKLVSIVTSIATDEDYKNLVVGNPDPEAVETTLNAIIDRIIRIKRTGDMSLYKQYQQNEEFKAQMRHVLIRMLNTIDSTPESTFMKGVGFTHQGQSSILAGAITAATESIAKGMDSVSCYHKDPSWKNVALSLKQPWASLVCTGIKDIENRTWQTDYRGRLYIVASSSYDNSPISVECQRIIAQKQSEGVLPDLNSLPQSAVIGYVDLEGCTGEKIDSIWSGGTLRAGNINWVLKNAHIFKQPLLPGFKAKLHLFEIPELDEDNLPPTK